MSARYLGVDVGGTTVKIGLIGENGRIEQRARVDAPAGVETGDYLDLLASTLDPIVTASGVSSLGLAVPGLLDRDAGAVLSSPNLPYLDGVPVCSELAGRLRLEREDILFENDANAAALGEQWLGAARGASHALIITLGTGIGGGLILGGELFAGDGLAGEIGHLTVDGDGPLCGCGSRGCLETLASATGARRRAVERGLPASAPGDLEELARLARQGEGPERELLVEVGRDLGHGIGNVICLLDIRTFVIAGGFAATFDILEPGIRAGIREWAYGDRVADIRLLRASLGPDAGWIGAARLTRRT